MSYQAEHALAEEALFQQRVRASSIEHASSSARASLTPEVLYSDAILRLEGTKQMTMFHLAAQVPGLADRVQQPDGSLDSSVLTDEEIASAVQQCWTPASNAYYNTDGTPKGS